MRRPRSFVAVTLVLVFALEHGASAVGSRNAAYVGGTVVVFGTPKDPVEGRLDTANPELLVFSATKKKFAGKGFSVPYEKVIDLEYGQKAGRRIAAAAGTAVLLGPLGLLFLFSKKRKHYLTIGFMGEDEKEQVVVLELGKDIVRTTLAIVETRSGKKIEYQDDEARKYGR